ncbi:hypothetical protein GUITHDRAFT_89574 [Guillardia theta CCMP2712]|uniref:Thioredoxin domain-containing protein n=1 Tax=Guillardia theta (strain CCMP2712) TaxID=905079 RepID=L1IPS4_GUITC|nr:hypothetical protein GUITHDRAFT_89574 [Guillardia theta CCMP2712]EKX37805.1 hypothetical protein GUITHDRAFT_89574 [Guillardia theta CCMP2712]|eukprot:XP_005824785.1 hypothetical protein GUITHDRAFT_89574 [Guillardia theta CCMP2712]
MTLHEILKDARLVGPGNTTFDASNLKDKYVGIYFSASWCQPCKAFTPQLIQMYSKLKIADGKPFEIVFVSADRSQEAFDSYFGQMPWFAVDFQDGNARSTLSSAIGVEGIPKLALFDTEGRLITGEGRRLVMDDPMGDSFPWTQ